MHSRLSKSPTIGGHPIPLSPVVPMPVRSTTLALVQRYLSVFVRYAGVGITGTLVHFLILVLLIGHTSPVVASTAGAIAGCLTNFRLASAYVFVARPVQPLVFPKFVMVSAIGVALNAATLSALTPFFPILVCQATASGLVVVTGFLLNAVWSYGEFHR